MKKTAFTMMELIIVIVIAGILAAVMMPRLERDDLREAANQVLRHIQYTQHLAMVNDIYNASQPNWRNALWQISFRNSSESCYLVGSSADYNTVMAGNETALDPLTKQRLYSSAGCVYNSLDNADVFLNKSYGITSVTLSNSCGGNRYIAFDNIGKPFKDRNIAHPITTPCTVTLATPLRNAVITIEPETGYSRITAIN